MDSPEVPVTRTRSGLARDGEKATSTGALAGCSVWSERAWIVPSMALQVWVESRKLAGAMPYSSGFCSANNNPSKVGNNHACQLRP